MLFPRGISWQNVVELRTFEVFFRQSLKCLTLNRLFLGVLISSQFVGLHTDFKYIAYSHTVLRRYGQFTWSATTFLPVTMDVKNWKGTQPLSPSKWSFNFLTLFLDFTLTSNTLFTYSRGHHSRVSDLHVLVNVHDLSPFSQITILETSCKRRSFSWSLLAAYESFDCIPYLSWG